MVNIVRRPLMFIGNAAQGIGDLSCSRGY